MNGTQLEKMMKVLGFESIGEFAEWLDIAQRTPRRWLADNPSMPLGVAMLLAVMRKHNVSAAEVRQLVGKPWGK